MLLFCCICSCFQEKSLLVSTYKQYDVVCVEYVICQIRQSRLTMINGLVCPATLWMRWYHLVCSWRTDGCVYYHKLRLEKSESFCPTREWKRAVLIGFCCFLSQGAISWRQNGCAGDFSLHTVLVVIQSSTREVETLSRRQNGCAVVISLHTVLVVIQSFMLLYSWSGDHITMFACWAYICFSEVIIFNRLALTMQ